jgi:hypothetical protein
VYPEQGIKPHLYQSKWNPKMKHKIKLKNFPVVFKNFKVFLLKQTKKQKNHKGDPYKKNVNFFFS